MLREILGTQHTMIKAMMLPGKMSSPWLKFDVIFWRDSNLYCTAITQIRSDIAGFESVILFFRETAPIGNYIIRYAFASLNKPDCCEIDWEITIRLKGHQRSWSLFNVIWNVKYSRNKLFERDNFSVPIWEEIC